MGGFMLSLITNPPVVHYAGLIGYIMYLNFNHPPKYWVQMA